MGHVDWKEKRLGELYFVEGDKTRMGWVFTERSTYEPRWFEVAARPGWVEKAEGLLVDARDSWAACGVEVKVGGFHDNAAVLTAAQWKSESGCVDEARQMLVALQEHIVFRGDSASERLLLPSVRAALEAITKKSPTAKGESACQKASSASQNRVAAFKVQLVDAAVLIAAISWTHGLVVHDLMSLPAFADSPASANVLAGSALAIALRFVSRAV